MLADELESNTSRNRIRCPQRPDDDSKHKSKGKRGK